LQLLKKCKAPKCVCITNNLKCTDMCKLQDCDNRNLDNNTDDDDDDDDDEYVNNDNDSDEEDL